MEIWTARVAIRYYNHPYRSGHQHPTTDGDGDEVPAKRGIPRESAGPIQEQAI